MYQLMINRKNSKKGFTLVEVIVVLVILAILAAIMIPAMTGWIDKARSRAAIVEGRTVLLAAQTLASEQYGTNAAGTGIAFDLANAVTLAGVTGTLNSLTFDTTNKAQITGMNYTAKNGQTVVYNANGTTPDTIWSVT